MHVQGSPHPYTGVHCCAIHNPVLTVLFFTYVHGRCMLVLFASCICTARYILSVTPRNKAPLPEGSTSPLHTAVHQGWPEVIARLIKQGYDPMQKDPYGL